MELLFTLAAFVAALAILIAVHEFGHFWAARRLGVGVLRFSIGFGRPLLRWQPGETEYVLAAIPLGGYVKMLDEREDPVPESDQHRAFNRQTVWKRSIIVLAGPSFNFLFAILAYWAIFMAGEVTVRPVVGTVAPQSAAAAAGFHPGDELLRIGAQPVRSWEDSVLALLAALPAERELPIRVRTATGHEVERWLPGTAPTAADEPSDPLERLGLTPRRPLLPPVIGELLAGEPAAHAGLRVGDRILSVDGVAIASWDDWVDAVRGHPGALLRVEVERQDGARLAVDLQPDRMEVDGVIIGRVGAGVRIPDAVSDTDRILVRYDPLEALARAVGRTLDMSAMTLRMAGRMLIGQASVENLSGPIAIAETAGRTASHGLDAFVKFLAVVSISLGILNLLPIPLLDGGHLIYFLIEALRGSPLSEQAQLRGQQLGLVLLAGLMTLAFYVDLARLLG